MTAIKCFIGLQLHYSFVLKGHQQDRLHDTRVCHTYFGAEIKYDARFIDRLSKQDISIHAVGRQKECK